MARYRVDHGDYRTGIAALNKKFGLSPPSSPFSSSQGAAARGAGGVGAGSQPGSGAGVNTESLAPPTYPSTWYLDPRCQCWTERIPDPGIFAKIDFMINYWVALPFQGATPCHFCLKPGACWINLKPQIPHSRKNVFLIMFF